MGALMKRLLYKLSSRNAWATCLLLAALGVVGFAAAAIFLVTQPMRPPEQAIPAPARADALRLRSHVMKLAGEFGPRDAAHPRNLDRVAGYIRDQLERTGGKVTEQPFGVDGRVYRNVCALYGPAGTNRIVVGAHYDTAGNRPGADDNASGVAGLLELAPLLRRTALPLQVELLAYTLEEPPYFRTDSMGSYRHARALKRAGVSVRLMISLEMIGYFSDHPDSQSFPLEMLGWLYPRQGNFIAVVGTFEQWRAVRRVKQAMLDSSPLPVCSINAPATVPGVDFSDHRSYWKGGYPAVMVTDTAFYRNRNYHTAGDTPDTLDYVRMAQVVDGVYAAAVAEASRQ